MAKSKVYKTSAGGAVVGFNMTPMIDVTFQLIIFFILAGQLASQELAQLVLSRPYNSQALDEKKQGTPNRVVVNVLSAYGDKKPETINPTELGKAKCYKIGMEIIDLDDIEKLTEILRKKKQAASLSKREKPFSVEIRADNRVAFEFVKPVMDAAAEAGIPEMKISALTRLADSEKK